MQHATKTQESQLRFRALVGHACLSLSHILEIVMWKSIKQLCFQHWMCLVFFSYQMRLRDEGLAVLHTPDHIWSLLLPDWLRWLWETDGNHWSEDIPECIPVVRERSDVCGWDIGQKCVSWASKRECVFLCVLVQSVCGWTRMKWEEREVGKGWWRKFMGQELSVTSCEMEMSVVLVIMYSLNRNYYKIW